MLHNSLECFDQHAWLAVIYISAALASWPASFLRRFIFGPAESHAVLARSSDPARATEAIDARRTAVFRVIFLPSVLRTLPTSREPVLRVEAPV